MRTTQRLHQRIVERFPQRNLRHVSAELVDIATEARKRIDGFSKPNYLLRTLILLVIGLFIFGVVLAIQQFGLSTDGMSLLDLLEVLEAGINDVLFMAAAVYFLVTLERRLKVNKIKSAMQELRTLAHIIDAYQLTKDPQRISHRGPDTASSPQETLTAFELTRYLDYCSEMLSLIGKLGALYAQSDDSDATIAAVNEIEQLTSGLAAKIWQKLMTMYQILEIDAEGLDDYATATEQLDATVRKLAQGKVAGSEISAETTPAPTPSPAPVELEDSDSA